MGHALLTDVEFEQSVQFKMLKIFFSIGAYSIKFQQQPFISKTFYRDRLSQHQLSSANARTLQRVGHQARAAKTSFHKFIPYFFGLAFFRLIRADRL